MEFGIGVGVGFQLRPGENVDVPEPTVSQLLIEGGTDALLLEGGDALILES